MNTALAKKPTAKRPATRQATAKKPAPKRAITAKPAAKPTAKSPAKSPAKRVTPTPSAPASPSASKSRSAAVPAEKSRKPKLVRDSFTIPKAEYAVIEALKQRAAQAGRTAKKSEVLRAGLMALAAMATPAFLAALQAVPPIKTGRPAAAPRE